MRHGTEHTAGATLSEYLLLIPIHFNSGLPVPLDLRAAIERAMCERFGGFHVDRGHEGAWVAPDGRRYDDVSDAYILAATDPARMIAFAREVGAVLAQHAVYLRLPNNRAVIVPIPPCAEREGMARPFDNGEPPSRGDFPW